MKNKKDLDFLIKKGFSELLGEVEPSKRKFLNPNSIRNFIFHLVDNPKLNQQENNKLQELGGIRIKNQLLEFYSDVRNTELDKNVGADLYKKHVFVIGKFMSKYYGFSASGGKIVAFKILIVLTIGVVTDMIISLFDIQLFPIFTILFIILYLARLIIKSTRKKRFGLFY